MSIEKSSILLYKTANAFNDYKAEDMRYGDLSATTLKREFAFHDVSLFVDPYTLTKKPLLPEHSLVLSAANLIGLRPIKKSVKSKRPILCLMSFGKLHFFMHDRGNIHR